MADTILRHIAMLSLIPARGRKTTARELHAKLADQGYDIDVRSIERDLRKLSHDFKLVSDEGRPAGWFYMDRDSKVRLPRMDDRTALTYELLSRYLTPILPRLMLKALEPDFRDARNVLESTANMPFARWSRRIAVLPFGHQLLPPTIDEDVMDVVYPAVLNERRFEVSYRSATADLPSRYTLNPQGLVYRQGVLYLVAGVWDYEDPRHFALHRMSDAVASDVPAKALPGFDFERYVRDEKSFDYPEGKDIRLELRVQPWLARHLEESRLSEDQVLAPVGGGELSKIVATVPNTEQLFWWLRSLGDSVEVVKPVSLRRKVAEQAKQLAEIYGEA
ncbi:MAG: WYL domain-containing protein [Dokdonella sp.]